MRAAVAVSLFVFSGSAATAAQEAVPLRKSDLIHLLTRSSLSKGALEQVVRRHCLTFTPTPRDREDLRAVGADSAILLAIDACSCARWASLAGPPRATPAAPSEPRVSPAAPKVAPVAGSDVRLRLKLRPSSKAMVGPLFSSNGA